MSASTALLAVVAVWLLIGVTAVVVMARRGHQPFTWGVLGAALGPLVIPLAWRDIRREPNAPGISLAAGTGTENGLEVLVGIDGSEEAHTAVDTIIEMVGGRLGMCTLASVIDFEAARSAETPQRVQAEALLSREAQHFHERTGRAPAQVLLPGRPASALRRYATDSGCQLLVLGSRGHGASQLVLGSVASEIVRGPPVPTFIVTAERSDRGRNTE